jgi:hypothetical protein
VFFVFRRKISLDACISPEASHFTTTGNRAVPASAKMLVERIKRRVSRVENAIFFIITYLLSFSLTSFFNSIIVKCLQKGSPFGPLY